MELNLSHYQNVMREMCSERVNFPLFIGGYGSGKSFILIYNAIADIKTFPGCKVCIYAPTYDILELNLVPEFEIFLDNIGISHTYNKQKHVLHLPGDRKLIFRSMADEKRIVGYQAYSSHIDEADLMTMYKARSMWDRIIARSRQQHPKHGKDTKMMVAAYSTPESFRFTYDRWKKNPGVGYKYVRAPTWSNSTLSTSYVRGLIASYTPQQQAAYLKGIWTNISSGNVYSYFDPTMHATGRVIEPGDTLYIGQDFNVGGCCGAVYVIDRTPQGKGVKVTMSQVDEYADVTTEDVVETLGIRYKGHRCVLFPDSTGRANNSNASPSDISILEKARYEIRADPTNPRIEDRVNAVQRLFYRNLLFINPDKCPQSVSARIEQAYNKLTGKPEKYAGPGTVDDRNDAGDYPIAKLFPIRSIVEINRVAQ